MRGACRAWVRTTLPNHLTKYASVARSDASFAVTGIPPGSWKVSILSFVSSASLKSVAIGKRFAAGSVTLVDGQTTKQDLDLTHVLPGTVEGLVLLNGKPFAKECVSITRENTWENRTTDGEGRFTLHWCAGEYQLVLQRPLSSGGYRFLHASTPISIIRGKTTTRTFAVSSGILRLRVLDSKGEVPSGTVSVRAVAKDGPRTLDGLDAEGISETEVAKETLELQVLPKELASREGQAKLYAEARARGEKDALASRWIRLQTVTLLPGKTSELEVRLPLETGY